MTTLAAWYAALKGLTVTGATARAEPPLKLESAQLPALWVDVVGVDETGAHKGTRGGERLLKARIVVLMAPPGQDRQANRWADTIAMADTLTTALAAMSTVSVGALEWTVSCDPNFDGSGYWAVVANVQAREWT